MVFEIYSTDGDVTTELIEEYSVSMYVESEYRHHYIASTN